MASKAESEAEQIAANKARSEALARRALDVLIGDAHPDDEFRGAPLAAALMSIVESWRANATELEGSTKRGTPQRRTELRAAAGLLAAVAVDIERLGPRAAPDSVARALAELIPVGPECASLAGPVIAGSFGPGDNPFDVSIDEIVARLAEPASPAAAVALLERDHDAARTDAMAFLSGATDTYPTPNGTPVPIPGGSLQVFDPSPRSSAPATPRLTYGAVGQLWAGLAPIDHRSFSQMQTISDCSMKQLLNRAARSKLIPGGAPQWASVGGTAFHDAIETIETHQPADVFTPTELEAFWTHHLDAAIVAEELGSGVPRGGWRVANKGLENYDWWRVEGARMVKLYLDHHSPAVREQRSILHLTGPDGGRLAIEQPFRLDVDGVAVDGFVDQVWLNPTSPTPYELVDLKAGRSDADTFQLATYAWALSRQWSVPIEQFTARFWYARKGIFSEPLNAAERHPWDELVWRYHNADRVERAQIATPRVSSFCHGCEFKAVCPAGPR